MKVKGLIWLGTKTDRFADMARFYEEVLGLRPTIKEPDFAVYRLPGGEAVELFGPTAGHDHFVTGPVAGFWVDDVAEARAEMEVKGVEFTGPTVTDGGYAWAHFRAPDGTVYEITSTEESPAETTA
jgi:catechol 2,3-dioxygenase-like lactoylglutathione lyase family enzyme